MTHSHVLMRSPLQSSDISPAEAIHKLQRTAYACLPPKTLSAPRAIDSEAIASIRGLWWRSRRTAKDHAVFDKAWALKSGRCLMDAAAIEASRGAWAHFSEAKAHTRLDMLRGPNSLCSMVLIDEAAIASRKGSSTLPSVEKAHAVLAMCCGDASGHRGIAAEASASRRGSMRKLSSAQDHAVVEMACHSNSLMGAIACDDIA
mmetsp:Transcript_1325/g.4463  ORF Transcript_1325/g.4463 Transcript_1325/m.4463 type:complete len:203 (+) Transcript_1325:125-733(+)